MRLLGGVSNRIMEGNEEERKSQEEKISKEEVKEAFRKIKGKKKQQE